MWQKGDSSHHLPSFFVLKGFPFPSSSCGLFPTRTCETHQSSGFGKRSHPACQAKILPSTQIKLIGCVLRTSCLLSFWCPLIFQQLPSAFTSLVNPPHSKTKAVHWDEETLSGAARRCYSTWCSLFIGHNRVPPPHPTLPAPFWHTADGCCVCLWSGLSLCCGQHMVSLSAVTVAGSSGACKWENREGRGRGGI